MASELDGLKERLDITLERLNALQKAIAIESDPNLRFTLSQQIEQYESEVAEVESKIAEEKKRVGNAYGLTATSGNSLLEQKIRELSIDINSKVGELFLVNIDRVPPRNRFWDAFDENLERKNPFQFYFVLACPTQQPNSFAERMIYELVIEELEENVDAINYMRQQDSRRVKVEDLPLGRNLRNSQREFKKYFARRFGLTDSETMFEDYIKTGLPKLEYQYVATVFDLNASKWDESLMQEYLQWIMDVFSNTHEAVPTFLFFFAVFIRDVHKDPLPPNEKKIVEGIQALSSKNQERCSLINQLTPVETGDIADWIRELGEQNESKIADVIKLLIAGLPDDKKSKFEGNKKLDMTDIERFQEVVYKIAIS
ncbi:MAG: hypothetical protein SFU99_09855 [Saprospiraceae bacterium]|nr:hypothetical protein [Saprospiraceae bacterium]